MKAWSDIMKLLVLLGVVAVIILGIHYLGSKQDRLSKYTHPITRPGASW